MFSYLVPSVARRELLRALWRDGVESSVSGLARRVGVSNTAALRELRLMRDAGLARVKPVGPAHVYCANREHPASDVLDALLAADTEVVEVRAASPSVSAWLNYLGAPFWEPAPLPPPSAEEALAAAVFAARRDARLAPVLPVVVWKQRGVLDWDKLEHHASHLGVKHELGFFVDMAGSLGRSSKLRTRARAFRDRRRTRARRFFAPAQKTEHPFLQDVTPGLAKRWGLLMDVDQQAFEDTFRKHAGAN